MKIYNSFRHWDIYDEWLHSHYQKTCWNIDGKKRKKSSRKYVWSTDWVIYKMHRMSGAVALIIMKRKQNKTKNRPCAYADRRRGWMTDLSNWTKSRVLFLLDLISLHFYLPDGKDTTQRMQLHNYHSNQNKCFRSIKIGWNE